MREIKLSGKHGAGKVALVDDEDYDRVSARQWHLNVSRGGKCFYVESSVYDPITKKSGRFYLHRFILNVTDPDIKVDHEDTDTLNNQKYNLRPCSNRENLRNSKNREMAASIHKGVSWNKIEEYWECRIGVNNTVVWLGTFNDEALAAKAYNEAALLYHGKYARLNDI